DRSRKFRARVCLDHLDAADDLRIERRQLVGRHPQLLVRASARRLDRILSRECVFDLEPCHEAGVARPRVLAIPIARDLPRVLEREDGIEDRLMGEPGRKRTEPRLGDQTKLLQPDGTVEHHAVGEPAQPFFAGVCLPLSCGVVPSCPFCWRSSRVSRSHVRLSTSRTLKRSLPRPCASTSMTSPSWNALSPRWLVPVASTAPGSSAWIE